MEDLKKRIEALLFSSGRKMDLDEISKICHSNPELIEKVLHELKGNYDENKGSLMVINEGKYWKITVREEFLPLVQKIVTETELSKTMMETLAVIAFKYPIKQSDLIKIRTNKAYDHLNELEELGYISRQKFGRTKLIKLTEKFFEYFSLPEEKLKEQFKDFESIAKGIEEKESEIKKIKEQHEKIAELARIEKEKREKLGSLVVIEEPEDIEQPKVEIEEEKIGQLEVVDVPLETAKIEEKKPKKTHIPQEKEEEEIEEKTQTEKKEQSKDVEAIDKLRETEEKLENQIDEIEKSYKKD